MKIKLPSFTIDCKTNLRHYESSLKSIIKREIGIKSDLFFLFTFEDKKIHDCIISIHFPNNKLTEKKAMEINKLYKKVINSFRNDFYRKIDEWTVNVRKKTKAKAKENNKSYC